MSTHISHVVIRMSFQDSIPVEITVCGDELGNTVKPEDVSRTIAEFMTAGYGAPVSWNKKQADDKQTVIDKCGTVKCVNPITTKSGYKMYEVTVTLDDGGTEVKWNEFAVGAFRSRDRVKMVKNDKNFIVGQLITDEKSE